MNPEYPQLLAQFQRNGCEQSFTRLVELFSGLVYSTAFRCVGGDREMAKEVTQSVFVDFARKAKSLDTSVMLGGWLHRHTFFVASKRVRSEHRRREKEARAADMQNQDEETRREFERIAPVLDDAVNRLSQSDRAVILLRYYQELNYRDISQAIGLSEDASRMRVKRALGKLHGLLEKRGVKVASSALGTVLAGQVVQAAPASVGVALASTALSAASVQTGILTQIQNMFTLTQIKSGLAGVVLTAAVVTPVTIQTQKEKAQVSLDAQRAELSALQEVNSDLESRLETLEQKPSQPDEAFRELLRLRGEVGPMRDKLMALESENQQLHQLLKKFEEEAGVDLAAALEAANSPTSDEQTAIEKMNTAKWLSLGMMMFADQNDGYFPESIEDAFNVATDAAGQTDPAIGEALETWADHFEIIFSGQLKDMTQPSAQIILREKKPWQNAKGSWCKSYAFGDGHAEVHMEENGDFQSWEEERMPVMKQ